MAEGTDNTPASAPVHACVHTPGPWGVEQTTVSNWIGKMRADGSKVEYIVAHVDRDSLRDDVLVRNDANARLIAAAPELAEALRILYDFQNGPPLEKYRDEWNEAMRLARTALAKAGNL